MQLLSGYVSDETTAISAITSLRNHSTTGQSDIGAALDFVAHHLASKARDVDKNGELVQKVIVSARKDTTVLMQTSFGVNFFVCCLLMKVSVLYF